LLSILCEILYNKNIKNNKERLIAKETKLYKDYTKGRKYTISNTP